MAHSSRARAGTMCSMAPGPALQPQKALAKELKLDLAKLDVTCAQLTLDAVTRC